MTDQSSSTAAAGQAAPLQLHVYVSPTRPVLGPGKRTWSPVTSTLIAGETEAVLVDAGFLTEDVAALGDMIERTGKRLTTIFVTHGHGDHFYGSSLLAQRFPGVQVVASPGVVAYIHAHLAEGVKQFRTFFGDALAPPDLLPTPLAGDTIALEGRQLNVIEVGQGDIAPSSIVQIPELDAVIAGDVAYNQIHQMLALGGPKEWDAWIASVDKVERLHPKTVVVGHKKPDASDQDVAGILNGTRDYIRDFAEAAKTAASAHELIGAMVVKYPDRGNDTTLVMSATAAIKAKNA